MCIERHLSELNRKNRRKMRSIAGETGMETGLIAKTKAGGSTREDNSVA
jgi:hypothetical protein